jgi:F0F1-type ATP synthase membrane subunit c/vacuolar-type H+-ATPase subunit K
MKKALFIICILVLIIATFGCTTTEESTTTGSVKVTFKNPEMAEQMFSTGHTIIIIGYEITTLEAVPDGLVESAQKDNSFQFEITDLERTVTGIEPGAYGVSGNSSPNGYWVDGRVNVIVGQTSELVLDIGMLV